MTWQSNMEADSCVVMATIIYKSMNYKIKLLIRNFYHTCNMIFWKCPESCGFLTCVIWDQHYLGKVVLKTIYIYCRLSHQAHGEVYSIQLYVIKVVSDLRQISGFLLIFWVSSTHKTDRHDITEILLKVVLHTITP